MEWDTIYRALADALRRRVLSCLSTDEQLAVSELASMVIEDSSGGVSGRTRENVALELYHSHLPLLQDAGLVTFDSEQKVVALTDLGAEVELNVLLPSRELEK